MKAIITATLTFSLVSLGLPAVADDTGSPLLPIVPGELTVSGLGAFGARLTRNFDSVMGQLGSEVAIGVTPWTEAALQVRPVEWTNIGQQADVPHVEAIPMVDVALSYRMFPWGAPQLVYLAPVLHVDVSPTRYLIPQVATGVEAGLQGRWTNHVVAGIGLAGLLNLSGLPTSLSNSRIDVIGRIGYRF